ncbi:membrane-associated phospholipid phosphatase [Streptomyces sp. V3I8]|uniref:phosphatase PAP2 family protein n=1 Tax=Streptomyces sp. V3I8 TaxID=3042279 RepID=UPI002786050F|nr:phosphatase PAP2 family protein [Streptomyces sp. V3I8]MDQ1035856.1 membrane-associated phospholipid phosphatase [Streptomyces sp. V3I8]
MTSVPDRRSSPHTTAPDSDGDGDGVDVGDRGRGSGSGRDKGDSGHPEGPSAAAGARTRILAPFALPLGLLSLFALLTWQAAVDTPLRRADERLARTVADSRLPEGAAEFLADLGNVAVAVPVLLAVAAYVAWRARRAALPRWWLPPLAALALMALVPVLVVPLKEAVGRTGPPGTAGDGYYPSGHTATAAVAYGAAVLLLLPWLSDRYLRRELTIACVLLVAAVGYGLVRRGYHWPLDVAGSWCLGAALLLGLSTVLARSGTAVPGAGARPE